MAKEDRRLRPNDRPTLHILAAWLVVCLILLATGAPKILAGEYHGPDDALRMVQVRDLLAGQAWFDLHQYRITPPDGVLMHWSRLVDAPIAALSLFFSLFLEPERAELAAMIGVPLLTLLLTMLVLGRVAWRLFDRQIAILTSTVLVLMPMIAIQFQPMRVDHHGWQILAVAVAVWGLTWRSAAHGGAVAGLAMAFGLMVSLEPVFMVAGFGIVLFLRWVRDQKQRWWLVSYLQALALGLVILFGATRGLSDLEQHCDVVSPPHLGFFLIAALGTGALAVPPMIPRLKLLVGLTATGLVAAGFLVWSAPQCLTPPFSQLDPLVRDFWYYSVSEGRPIWEQKLRYAAPAAIQPVIALVLVVVLGARARQWKREWWIEYGLLLLIAFGSGVATFRSMAFAGVLCAIPFGWLLSRFFIRWRSYEKLLPKAGLAIVIYFFFLPAFPFVLANKMTTPSTSPETPVYGRSSCDLRQNASLLNDLPTSTVFAPLDVGPVLLLKTRHSVVASGHHRAEQAIRDVIVAFTGPTESAKEYVDAYGADYLFVCTDLLEPQNYMKSGGEDAFVTRLIAGDLPNWLEEVELGGPEELKAWRVIRD